jgi:hypothetical protein
MALGRVQPYKARTPQKKAIAEATRRILGGLNVKPTLRQLFYLLVSEGLVAKTEKGYEQLKEQTARMRRGGYIGIDALIDGTRQITAWRFHERPSTALEEAAWSYARDPWAEQPAVAELWCEADTHRELLRPVAMDFSVPLVITRGNASLSHMYSCVQAIVRRWEARRQLTHIVYVGDHDPPGIDMSLNLHKRLAEWHMPPYICKVERVALTIEQIHQYNLPTRPPKPQDSRTPWYEDMFPGVGCVELDALEPQLLVDTVRAAINRVIYDRELWEQSEQREREERARLRAFIKEHSAEVDGA